MSQRGSSNASSRPNSAAPRRSPLVLYTIIAIGLLVVAGIVLAISGGGADPEVDEADAGAGELLAGADGAGRAEDGAEASGGAVPAVSDEGVAPELQEWAQALRSAGYRVAFGEVEDTTIDRVEIAGPDGALTWIFAAENVSVTGFDGGTVTATIAGQPSAGTPAMMELTLARDGVTRTYGMSADVATLVY